MAISPLRDSSMTTISSLPPVTPALCCGTSPECRPSNPSRSMLPIVSLFLCIQPANHSPLDLPTAPSRYGTFGAGSALTPSPDMSQMSMASVSFLTEWPLEPLAQILLVESLTFVALVKWQLLSFQTAKSLPPQVTSTPSSHPSHLPF